MITAAAILSSLAHDSEIFIQSHQKLDELKDDLARTLRLDFSHWDEANRYWAGLAESARVLLYAHSYRPVGDLRFDRYPFVLAVEGPQALTRELFRQLVKHGRWALLMTDDLQVRLDSFEPTATENRNATVGEDFPADDVERLPIVLNGKVYTEGELDAEQTARIDVGIARRKAEDDRGSAE